ncbi:hypothetical protein [Prevotella koreensis]|nr:hypothetical protein [Prevotella koreensis]
MGEIRKQIGRIWKAKWAKLLTKTGEIALRFQVFGVFVYAKTV